MKSNQKYNFWLYAFGTLISVLGSGIQSAPIGIYIYDITKSGFMMSVFSLLLIVPRLIIMPFAGVIGDRFDRKNIMISMDISRGVILIWLSLLIYLKVLNIPVLFLTQGIISGMDSIFNSATNAMLPDLVPEEELKNSNSIMQVIKQSCFIIGPVAGFALYGFLGIGIIFFINGISFILSGISEVFLNYKVKYEMANTLKIKDFIEDVKTGGKFIISNKPLIYFIIFELVINFLIEPVFQIVIPYVLRKELLFSNEKLGLVQTFFVIGAIIGGLIMGSIFSNIRGRRSITIGIIPMCFILIPMGTLFMPETISFLGSDSLGIFTIFAALMIIEGISISLLNITINTNFQLMTPSKLRARTMSVLELLGLMSIPIGSFITGLIIDKISGYIIFITIGILSLLFSVLFLFVAPDESFEPKLAINEE